jgi:hypothetical protein
MPFTKNLYETLRKREDGDICNYVIHSLEGTINGYPAGDTKIAIKTLGL